MAFFGNWFNRYPGTDFSQINLDWIVGIVRDVKATVDNITGTIETAVNNVFHDMLEAGTIRASFTITVENEEMTISPIIMKEV